MSITNYTISRILNFNFYSTATTPALTSPSSYYLGLSSALLDKTITGTGSASEISGGSYGRASIPSSAWGNAASGSITNSVAAVSFPSATTNWASVQSVFMTDTASSTGYIWWYSNLDIPILVTSGKILTFPTSSVTVSDLALAGTTYMNNKLLNFLFGGDSFSAATPLYIGLSTTTATVEGGYTEPSGGNYARVQYVNASGSGTRWTGSGSGSSTTNYVAVTFPTPSTAWGTIKSIFFADALTSGNVLWYQTLTTPLYVQAYATLTFPANSGIVISMA